MNFLVFVLVAFYSGKIVDLQSCFSKPWIWASIWLEASSASHAGTDVDASHTGIKHSLKYANVGFQI